jgi:hypothetical protein
MGRYVPHTICVLAIIFIFGFGFALGQRSGEVDGRATGTQEAFARSLAVVQRYPCESDICRGIRGDIFMALLDNRDEIKTTEQVIDSQ